MLSSGKKDECTKNLVPQKSQWFKILMQSTVVKAWWLGKEDRSYDALESTDRQNGFDESLN